MKFYEKLESASFQELLELAEETFRGISDTDDAAGDWPSEVKPLLRAFLLSLRELDCLP